MESVLGKNKPVKVKVPRKSRLAHFILSPVGRFLLVLMVLVGTVGLLVFTHYYVKYSHLIDRKLRTGPFPNTSRIYAAPKVVGVGDQISLSEVVSELRRAGYNESRNNLLGSFHLRSDAIEIFPGPDSYFGQEAGVIQFATGRISRIISTQDNTERRQFQLEPQLITNLFDRNREKRRLVRFDDIPKVLVNAVISAEDKRFFQHSGFDPFRVLKAAYVDLKEGRKEQGASTLSMQLARGLWLEPDKRWTRKAAEVLITLQLEQKLSKPEIFEFYANQIYLGRRGSFNIHGFGEGAEVYFGKEIRQLTLSEAATLAGLVQRPGHYNPFRYPERMSERRNVVLSLMHQNGFISDREYAVARDAPLNLAKGPSQSLDAPYFVDLVNDELQARFQDQDFQNNSHRIYTTLDLDLQRAGSEAVRIGMQNVDELLNKQKRHRNQTFPDAQVALIALDPHTGEIKALVGGRNYGVSQLNHVTAKRQPGSSFKPFVYAAALNTAVQNSSRVFTPTSMVVDEPTTFWFDSKPYEPDNFKHEFHGPVSFRRALAKSMNVATVRVAEMVGYDAVVDLAQKAGLNYNIHPTPAVALGAYEVMPIEIAGAYTVFSNQGVYVKPNFITMVRSQKGSVIYKHKPEQHEALDPRVAYLMVNMLEEVMRTGTAAGVRARGFTVPAAGKTGTSRDGWFAGFTSELLCIVWVGFDDNRTLNLEGAHSALPIWTEFMKRALQYRPYRNVKPFEAPDGIVSVEIDPDSGMPATPFCPSPRSEVYIAGTQPVGACPLHGGAAPNVTTVAGWEMPPAQPQRTEQARASEPAIHVLSKPAERAEADPSQRAAAAQPEKPKEQKEKKKGFFRRIFGVFK